jgi:paraquat-inducible protein A
MLGVTMADDRRVPAAAAPARAAPSGEVAACPDCDLLQRLPARLPAGARARCVRCGCLLAATPRHGHDTPLALAITAAIVYLVAMTSPLMSLSAVGRASSTTIAGGAIVMWQQGQPVTAALVLFCAVLAPGAFIAAMVAVQVAARRDPVPRWCGDLLRVGHQVQPWAMFEVMLLGILVALIKIAELATVEAGAGLYAMALLALLFPAMIVSFDPRQVWPRIAWADGSAPPGQRRR